MSTLLKSASQEASNTKVKALEDLKGYVEEILDSSVDFGVPHSAEFTNLPALVSYFLRFQDLQKLSENDPQPIVIHPEPQKSPEGALDVQKSENCKENGSTAPTKKAAKIKTTRGSKSPQGIAGTASKIQELSSSKHSAKDFFGSMSWYKSNRSYYDKRLQLTLDDFTYSGSSNIGSKRQHHDYLLLDSRVTGLTEWPGFIRAVFFVGNGKNQRVFDHCIKEAANIWMVDGEATNKKISRILDIWRGDGAVIVLTMSEGLVEHEVQTRQALVIEALGKQRLCNKNLYGSFHGASATLNAREKQEIGATLLVKARERLIEDGANCIFAPIRLEKNSSSTIYSQYKPTRRFILQC